MSGSFLLKVPIKRRTGPQKSVAEGIAGVWQGAHLAVGCWGSSGIDT